MLEKDLELSDIFDSESLQQLQQVQDAFFHATGLSAIFVDTHGAAITTPSTSQPFSGDLISRTENGKSYCEKCDQKGLELAIEKKKPIFYKCHGVLIDFAAPIIIHDKALGGVVGGRVSSKPLTPDQAREYASQIGADPEAYAAAAEAITLIDENQLKRDVELIFSHSEMVSRMAEHRFNIMQENSELDREAHMKSDFLANMSHEIRTPMNAVIGMAEMALREELTPDAREYINQIKTSGNSLLSLINDILDFSKIDSGKMDINMVDYEPVSIINDVANIIITRIGKKDLDLIMDFDPQIPCKLMGDSNRIKQIIINLANNAVKFTPDGKVTAAFTFEKRSDQEILLKVAITDTGIGIREEDMEKMFQSFQQLDSKRNRNIEGTGLGLAISKQLVALMNGNLRVESEYGKGSTFSFDLPQLVWDISPSVTVTSEKKIVAYVLSKNNNISEALQKDFQRFGAEYIRVQDVSEISDAVIADEDTDVYLFVDHPVFKTDIQNYVKSHKELNAILMIDFGTTIDYGIPNLLIVKKPMYSLNIATIFNHEDLHQKLDKNAPEKLDFIAPGVKVLIVDDNPVNLTVAAGLMKPFQMKIETALSGKEAIEMISTEHYDIIFMDHMMPELDGIETTHIIREFHEDYISVPIIALTANAMEEMRSKFLVEGMNDFIAKPIEMGTLINALKLWLPADKIQELDPDEARRLNENFEQKSLLPDVPGLDMEIAKGYLGNEQLVLDVLRDYHHVIGKKASVIEQAAAEKDYDTYTIEVHALKSSSRQVGAITLSDQAAKLEQAGKDHDDALIQAETDDMLQKYRNLGEMLDPYFAAEEADDSNKEEADSKTLLSLFDKMLSAIDELDMDIMDEVVQTLKGYRYDEEQAALLEQLADASESMDGDACAQIIRSWTSQI